MAKAKNKIVKLLKAGIELQAVVPVKSIKQAGEQDLREVAIKQDTEFGFEGHFDKDKIDKSKIGINFGFGKITLRKKDLRKALRRAGLQGLTRVKKIKRKKKCKPINLSEIKRKLINTYKNGRDETPILEKIEDRFHIDLTKDYGNDSPKKINSLFKRLKKLQKKGYEC